MERRCPALPVRRDLAVLTVRHHNPRVRPAVGPAPTPCGYRDLLSVVRMFVTPENNTLRARILRSSSLKPCRRRKSWGPARASCARGGRGAPSSVPRSASTSRPRSETGASSSAGTRTRSSASRTASRWPSPCTPETDLGGAPVVTADEGAGLTGAGRRRSWNPQFRASPLRLCR